MAAGDGVSTRMQTKEEGVTGGGGGAAEFQSVVVAVVVQSLNKQASHRYTGTANATSWASQRPQRNISSASHFEEVLKKLALAAL